ncbi:MAG: hypothetical protein AUH83_12270 [Deltaproteobacteria bacterium 13_1_40CM_4_68_19]|nr:MAG: hypothetical protein AUH83_12270 [Deltaproteobacteria bacterium 13_1_40CM_4_68_19]OLD47340.1 MAG: hypothetical protein AUI48_04205 [Chloroflexi bacterium 13_1_40CM_2_68_14]
MDAARDQVNVRPAQCEHLAGAQASQGADRVGHVERLGQQREEDAAHVVQPFDEGRFLRVVSRADQPHERLGQAARRVAGRETALGQIDEDRGEERDEDADGRRVQFLRQLHLDEGADAGDVDGARLEVTEVRLDVLLPPVAIAVGRAVRELPAVEDVGHQSGERRQPARVGRKPGAVLGHVAADLRQHALGVFASGEAAARAAQAIFSPADLPAAGSLMDLATAPLAALSMSCHRGAFLSRRGAGQRRGRPHRQS